jgi:RNA polymerase sigma factor (sigma-70 family)
LKFEWIDICEGSKDSYSKMYSSYYSKFFNYGRKFTDNIPLIEDVIQDVLVSIWINRKNLSSINNPYIYYFTVYRNALFKKIKEAKLLKDDIVDTEPVFAIDSIIISRETDKELKIQLEAALQKLTSRQREAIYLRFYENLSYDEVAAILNISVKATYKIMARALLQLKDTMLLPSIAILLLLRKYL